MPKNTILFLWMPNEKLKPYLEEKINAIGDFEFIYPDSENENHLSDNIHRADILIGWQINKEMLDKADKLQLFINPGTGIKRHIPVFRELVKTKPHLVLVNGHGHAYLTAQHCLALLFSLSNKIIPHHKWMAEGKWRLGDKEAASYPLNNKTIGLLGYGAINQTVHQYLSGFNTLRFAACRNNWTDKNQKGIYPTDLQKFSPAQLNDFFNNKRCIDHSRSTYFPNQSINW